MTPLRVLMSPSAPSTRTRQSHALHRQSSRRPTGAASRSSNRGCLTATSTTLNTPPAALAAPTCPRVVARCWCMWMVAARSLPALSCKPVVVEPLQIRRKTRRVVTTDRTVAACHAPEQSPYRRRARHLPLSADLPALAGSNAEGWSRDWRILLPLEPHHLIGHHCRARAAPERQSGDRTARAEISRRPSHCSALHGDSNESSCSDNCRTLRCFLIATATPAPAATPANRVRFSCGGGNNHGHFGVIVCVHAAIVTAVVS